MNARKLDLSSYEIAGGTYETKRNLKIILFHPQRQLNALGLVEVLKLWEVVDSQGEGNVILSEGEWEKLKQAFMEVKGFGEGDIELVQRVMETPIVEVNENAPVD